MATKIPAKKMPKGLLDGLEQIAAGERGKGPFNITATEVRQVLGERTYTERLRHGLWQAAAPVGVEAKRALRERGDSGAEHVALTVTAEEAAALVKALEEG